MKKDRRRPSRREAAGGEKGTRTSPRGTRAPAGPISIDSLDRIPKWLPVFIYAIVTLILFREFIFSEGMLIGIDTFSLGYVARSFFAAALGSTGFPLWNPYILGGTPFIESLAGGDSLYPPSVLLLFLFDTYRALGWKLVLHVFLAGVFMHLWLRTLGVSRAGSLIGSLAFMTAPYLVTLVYPGHDGKLFVTALTPLLFLVTELALVRRGLHWPAAVGGVVALVILTTHFQMAYFLFGAVGAYAIYRSICMHRAGEGEKRHTRLALFLAFSVLGAGAAGVQLIPAVGYVSEYSRRAATTTEAEGAEAVAYSSSWSLHPEEVVSLVVPEFVGASTNEADWTSGTYWGRNAFKLNHEYLGVLTLLLAAVAFLGGPRPGIRWFLAAVGGIALLFALGAHTPVWRIFFEILPGVSLFRAPSMAIFLTGFAVATLAGIGFDRGVVLAAEGEGSRLLRLSGILSGVLLVAWLTAVTGILQRGWLALFDADETGIRPGIMTAAEPFFIRGFFIAFLFAALLLLLWWATTRRILPVLATAAAVAFLVATDQMRVDGAYIGTVDFSRFSTPDENVRYLMQQASTQPPFRVFSMMSNGQDVLPAMYGIELAAGHHPNDLLRYRELIGMEGSGIPVNLANFHPNVLRILNVQYILWPDSEYPLDNAPAPLSRIELSDGSPYASVYSFPGLPRARVVGEAIVVSEDETLDVILGNHDIEYDPFRQTVLTEAPPIDLGAGDATGSVVWEERSPNQIRLQVMSTGPGLLVLADNWFPGWKAFVDGIERPVLRADHTLRAVPIEIGSHTVEFRYEPSLLRTSFWITILSILLLLGSAGWSLRGHLRQ